MFLQFFKILWPICIPAYKALSEKSWTLKQGSGNCEIWIGPADDNDVINEPISKKKYNITCHEN